MSPVRRSAVALAWIGLLLISACGQPTANDSVISVRPTPVPSAETGRVSFDATGLGADLKAQLDYASSLTGINGDNYLALGLLALDSTLTFKQTERLIFLQQLGQGDIDQRLNALAVLRNQVVADGTIPQKGVLTNILDSTSAALLSMRATIGSDQLVDKTRADIIKIATLRTYGLVLPQVHMLIAAYQIQHLAAIYSGQILGLKDRIVVAASQGINVTRAVNAERDLEAQIGIMNRASYLAIVTLPNLSAAGYPGNKGTVLMVRNNLTAGKYAASQAGVDSVNARV
jgi:hypothetical protein